MGLRLTQGYLTLGMLEKLCSHVQFQEPKTKLWLFDTMETHALLYGVDNRSHEIEPSNGWISKERHLTMMIAKLFVVVSCWYHTRLFLRQVWHLLWQRPSRRLFLSCMVYRSCVDTYVILALKASQNLVVGSGDEACWYIQLTIWFGMPRCPSYLYNTQRLARLLDLTSQGWN